MKNFSENQRKALLDMAMVAMYADGHLTGAEDQRINQLLGKLGFTTGYTANQAYDAAVARAREHAGNAEAASSYLNQLAKSFADAEQQQMVVSLLEDLVKSDRKIEAVEESYVRRIRAAFGM